MSAKLFLLLLPLAHAAISEHRVSSLPGWEWELPSRQYSGFISAEKTQTPGHERMLHYVFVEAENNPETAPVVLWTNGGPGCSSLEGWMMEMGPLRPDPTDPSGRRLTRNPMTWSLYANMLYLEHGVGVGFSYSNSGDVHLDDESDAEMVQIFLRNFFFPSTGHAGFPEFSSNDFYLTGESYAGVYIPHIANHIRLANLEEATAAQRINLQGFMIGNGCSGSDTFNCGDPPENTQFLKSSGGMKLDFLHGHGLVGTTLFDEIVDACPDPKPDWGYDGQCSGLTKTEMCGMDIQGFIDQYFNPASCMGPIPERFLGKNFTTTGSWASVGGTKAGYTADELAQVWNASLWPMIRRGEGEASVAHLDLNASNVWRMDKPGPELTKVVEGIWPAVTGGDTTHDPLGRRVHVECCAKYDLAMERLGTVNIYNIDDHDCTPGSLSAVAGAERSEADRGRDVREILAAKGMPLDDASASPSSSQTSGLRSTAFDAARMRAQLHKPGYTTVNVVVEPMRDLDACGGDSFNVRYFNRPDVWAALNVDREGPAASAHKTGWKWAECASRPLFNYTKTTASHTELYQKHLVPEMRVTIFSGDVDACVPYLGTMRWVADVAENYTMIGNDWNAWTADSNVAGYFSTWDVPNSAHNFTFSTVRGAGHMVPETQPKSALALFYRFLHGLPMQYAEPEPLRLLQENVRIVGGTSQLGTAAVGSTVTLAVDVDGGVGPLSYQWFRDGHAVDSDSFGSQLTLHRVVAGRDGGSYYCTITSGLGTSVTSQPLSLTIQDASATDTQAGTEGTAEWLLDQREQGGGAWWRWGLVCVAVGAAAALVTMMVRHRVARLNAVRAGVLEMEEGLYSSKASKGGESATADRSWSGSYSEVEVSTV